MTPHGTRGGGLRSWPMPRLIRFVLLHAAIGWLVAAIFVAALLHSDPGGIGTLLTRSQEGWGPLLLLWFFTGLTFGSAQLGAAVMLLGDDDADRGGGRRRPEAGSWRRRRAGFPHHPAAVPLMVRVRRR